MRMEWGDAVELPPETDGGAIERDEVTVSYLSRLVAEPRADLDGRRRGAGRAARAAGLLHSAHERGCDRPDRRVADAARHATSRPAASGRRRRPGACTTPPTSPPTSSRTIDFYQGLLGFPLTELFENRDYPGSTHFFFDIGGGNALAFFDFPGLDVGPYAEVLGGHHHLAISVEPAQWQVLRRAPRRRRHRVPRRRRRVDVLPRARRRAHRAARPTRSGRCTASPIL